MAKRVAVHVDHVENVPLSEVIFIGSKKSGDSYWKQENIR
jgi:hypothetical protein